MAPASTATTDNAATPFAGTPAAATVRPVDRVVIDHQIMGGVPCVRGTRIPVVTILGLLSEGATIDEIIEHYQQLTRQDILDCLRYAADTLDHRSTPLTAPE